MLSAKGLQRRKFLTMIGGTASVITIAAACNDDDDVTPPANQDVNLGSGDVGILNYAYALEQLEAAFYIKVVSSFYTGATDDEKSYLTDVMNHEIAHREFFKKAIPDGSRIGDLTPDFSTIDFTSKASVLGAAKVFEDIGVSAYNGAGPLISASETGKVYLTLAGKIVSVEARHAALIRDLIAADTFADDLDANASDISRTPDEVLALAGAYVKNKINASGLPK